MLRNVLQKIQKLSSKSCKKEKNFDEKLILRGACQYRLVPASPVPVPVVPAFPNPVPVPRNGRYSRNRTGIGTGTAQPYSKGAEGEKLQFLVENKQKLFKILRILAKN